MEWQEESSSNFSCERSFSMHKKQQRDREEIEKYLQTKGLVSIDHLFEILQDPSGQIYPFLSNNKG